MMHIIKLRSNLQTERQVLLKGGIRRVGLPQLLPEDNLMGHIRQRISFRSQILPVQHGGCVQLRQVVKADNRGVGGGGGEPSTTIR